MNVRTIILTPFFRPIVGGVESNAERLARYFGAHDIGVTVVTKRITRDLPDVEAGDGFQVERIGSYGPRAPMAKWQMLPAVVSWLRAHHDRYDVVCSIDCRGVGLGALAARITTGKPVIAQPQTTGVLIPESGAGLYRQAAGRLAGQLYARADAVACIARTIEREAIAAGVPPARVHFLPNAIDMTRFRPPTPAERAAARRRYDVADGEAVCVFVGRLSREKGLMDLMEAWRLLRPTGATLVIAGPDMSGHAWDVGERARAFARDHQLTASTRFIGPTDDVASVMHMADVAIQPSHFEALGLSAIEALACGAPVIASGVGGLLDFVHDDGNGLTVPPHDANALARAIESLLADPGRRARLAAAARISVEQTYDERIVFGRFATVVRTLAGSRA